MKVSIHASAAKGIIERRGICKVKHIDIDNLWLQEQEARRLLPLGKIEGTKNPADLMTKNLAEASVERHVKSLHLSWEEGRAQSAA